MARRQRKGRCAKCSRSEALYIMNRMLMNSVARMISAAGVPCEGRCAVATIDAPAKTKTDIAIAASGAMPLATIAAPVMTPKGTMPRSTGSDARSPWENVERSKAIEAPDSTGARWLQRDTVALLVGGDALLVQAGAELVPGWLAVARVIRLVERCGALLEVRLALRRVLRLGAYLLAHAVAVLLALLAFARAARLLVRRLHLLVPGLAAVGSSRRGLRVERSRCGQQNGAEQGGESFKHVSSFRGRSHESNGFAVPQPTVRCNSLFQPSCLSIVAPSDTSNLPGPSMLSCFTMPLSTSIEKRCMRVPMPRALRSSSRPSALVQLPLPSARKRILPSAFWSLPQCAMTNASLVATHHTSLTPFFFS